MEVKKVFNKKNRKRKVACARKHFRSMNIDYRPIFPDFTEWWSPEESKAM
jgi:hypothetical protein